MMSSRCPSGIWHILALATLLSVLVSGLGQPALAQSPAGVSLTAQAGLDGICKNGQWIPIRVQVENQGSDLEGRLEARLAVAPDRQTIYAQAIHLPNPSRKEISLPVYPEGFLSTIEVVLVAGGKVVAQTTLNINCLSTTDAVYGVLAASPSAFGRLAGPGRPGGRATIAQLTLADLPEQPQVLGMLDVLLISDTDTGALTPGQHQALAAWVNAGGKLVVTGGPEWQKTAAGLVDLLPLSPAGLQTLISLDSLSAYAGKPASLPGPAPAAQGALSPGAQVLVAQAGFPLVIAKTTGSGRVYFLAANPALEPLQSWPDISNFYRTLLTDEPSRPGWSGGISNWPLASTAITALPGLKLPAAGWVIGLMLVYVFAIGPLNYWLLRLFKRRELAWLSIPLLVIAFSGLAFLAGSRTRGSQPVLNRLAIVQVWPGTAQAQVDGLLGIFSPRRATYQPEIGAGFLAHTVPESDSLARRGGWVFVRQENGNTSLPNLRLDVAGINAVALVGQVKSPAFSSNLAVMLDSQGATVRGSLTNGGLELKDAVFMAMGNAQHLGDLQPGETRELQFVIPVPARAAQAGWSPSGGITKAVPAQPVPGPNPVAIPGVPYTDTLGSNLLGTTDYYRDQETFRRYSLLSAAAGPESGMQPSASFYLAGWSNKSPLPASVNASTIESSDTTLYLVALGPAFSIQPARIVLSPGLFTWSILAAPAQSSPAPYDSSLPPGTSTFRFRLSQPVAFRAVTGLTLHLKSYGASGPTSLQVSLWDFSAQKWAPLPVTGWGDTAVPDPANYVGPNGETRLQLDNPSGTVSTYIEAADFSLAVEK